MSAGGRKYPQRPPAASVARDPRGECDHAPEHVTSDGTRWPLTCDACRDTRQLVHFHLVSFLWRHRDALQLVLAAILLGALAALLVGAWWLW